MASLIKNMSDIVSLLESYRGRDRVMRILTYVAMFMGSNGKTPGQVKWRTVAGELGACRVVLRLFDDTSMLLLNLSSGFGLKTPAKSSVIRILNLLSGILNQSFYPSEHIAWLRQKKIITGEPGPYLILGVFIWATSLFVEAIKSLLKIREINIQCAKFLKQKELDRDNSSQNDMIKDSLRKLSKERADLYLLFAQSCCDLTNAVSWLPPGCLWAGSLTPRINGLVGVISSAIILYRNWPPPKRS